MTASNLHKPSEDPCETYLNEGEGDKGLHRWYYNPFSGICQGFVYRGLKGNENNFLTKQLCEQSCQPCKLTLSLEMLAKDLFSIQCVLRGSRTLQSGFPDHPMQIQWRVSAHALLPRGIGAAGECLLQEAGKSLRTATHDRRR